MTVNNNYPYPNKTIRNTSDYWLTVLRTIDNALNGKTNNAGEFEVTASAASTTVEDILCNENSVIVLTPISVNAATEFVSGNMYVEAGDGSFEVFHTNSATTDRDFRYLIVG